MGDREKAVAKKYAQAFYNVYGKSLTLKDMNMLEAAHRYCVENPALIWLLKIPCISDHLKKEALDIQGILRSQIRAGFSTQYL